MRCKTCGEEAWPLYPMPVPENIGVTKRFEVTNNVKRRMRFIVERQSKHTFL